MSNHIYRDRIHSYKDEWEKDPFQSADIDKEIKQGQKKHTPAAGKQDK